MTCWPSSTAATCTTSHIASQYPRYIDGLSGSTKSLQWGHPVITLVESVLVQILFDFQTSMVSKTPQLNRVSHSGCSLLIPVHLTEVDVSAAVVAACRCTNFHMPAQECVPVTDTGKERDTWMALRLVGEASLSYVWVDRLMGRWGCGAALDQTLFCPCPAISNTNCIVNYALHRRNAPD